MKKLVTVSLFIFWAVVTATLTAGLVFYQNQQNSASSKPTELLGENSGQLMLNAQEIAKHNSTQDCWLIINSKVYNVTSYLSAHPGGVSAIAPYCGQDGTAAFNTKGGSGHSSYANSLLASYYIGTLNQTISQTQIDQNIQNTNNIPLPASQGDDDEEEDD